MDSECFFAKSFGRRICKNSIVTRFKKQMTLVNAQHEQMTLVNAQHDPNHPCLSSVSPLRRAPVGA